jgi:pyruvate/2-oxoglutarate dehydrogenase complex dihydrolipoamide acyltransferase (E2) component
MGQPIHLRKGKDTMTVYGQHQAAVHVGEGWQLVDDSIALPIPPPVAVDATDAAAELANEHGIDLATVKGTGSNGRITVGDVRALVNGD